MRSLGLKLTLAFLAVSLLGIALLAFLASRIVTVEFGNFVDEQNQVLVAEQLADYYVANGNWNGARLSNPRFIGGRGGGGRSPFTVTDLDGTVVIPGPGQPPGSSLPADSFERGQPITVDGNVVGYVLEARGFERSQYQEDFARRVNVTILLAALGAAGISVLLGILLTRSLTRPLNELTEATERVAEGDLAYQVPVRTQDEIGQLAASFNQMSDRLHRSQIARRQMTADIAHDLRTPLSIILGHAEALSDGVLPPEQQTFDVMYEEAQRLNRLIEDLRILSLVEAGELAMAPRLTSASHILDRAFRAHQHRAQEDGISLTLDVAGDLPEIKVDPDRMAQVMDNLLANALQHTPPDGRVSLRARQNGGALQLSVQDTGSGLTEAEAARVFNRFYRGDTSRQRQDDGGTGLGLAIARSIVVAHGGQISVESESGQGATFTIRLPLAAAV